MTILRVRMRWSGFNGGPGYSVFHFNDFGAGPTGWEPTVDDAINMVAKVDAFAEDLLGVFPAGLVLNVQGDVEAINPETGALEDIFPVTAPPGRTPAHGAGPYSAPVGAVITWRTGVVRNGRRIRGRTFLVPLIGATFENNGSLTAGALATINSATATFVANTGEGDLCVWARPTTVGGSDGTPAFVSGYTIPDMGAVLRSRRD